MERKKNRRKGLRNLVLIGIAMLCIGLYIGNKQAKKYGYSSIVEVAKTYFKNKKIAATVTPIQLNIKIGKSDFDFIKQKREIALNRGLQINEGDNYVPCDLTIDGETVTGVIRLKGHMTDHLQGNKWSFRIKSDETVMDMYRFSLQHPGTRNYAYEWVYHQLLKQEGVIYLNYNFIDVNLNGESLGIYAVEEHFGQHVLEHNNRPKGAILRWNPNLYWEWRIDEFQGAYLDEQYSHYSSSFAEPYDKGVVKKDSILLNNYRTGAHLLEQFRRGELKTSEVFDVEKMARFHVIIDLVGGYHSLDWSDVKFFYNSESQKIEPVGYESFSIRKTERIAGQRISKNYSGIEMNYHNQLFSDPVFFEAYIQNMERIVEESYLDKFFKSIAADLNQKTGIISKEWAHRKMSFEGYYENVRLIRNNISLPKPFHAFLEDKDSNSINLSIVPVSDFPIQIIGLKRKDKVHYFDTLINLAAKPRETFTHYFDYTFNHPFKNSKDILILAKIPGSSETFEVVLSDYPSYKKAVHLNTVIEGQVDTTILSLNETKMSFKHKVTTIDHKIIVPESHQLMVYPDQTLKFVGEGAIVVRGELNLQGYPEDGEVLIYSDHQEAIVIENGLLKANNVNFTGKISIQSHQANLSFKNCQLYDLTNAFLEDYQSTILFLNCRSGNMSKLGHFNESELNIEDSYFTNGEQFLSANASLVALRNSSISSFRKVIKLDYSSQLGMWLSTLSQNDTIAEMTKASTINIYGGEVAKANIGFVLDDREALAGESNYTLYKTTTKQITTLEKRL